MSEKIVQLNEEIIQSELKELVRSSVVKLLHRHILLDVGNILLNVALILCGVGQLLLQGLHSDCFSMRSASYLPGRFLLFSKPGSFCPQPPTVVKPYIEMRKVE
ncbi:MAG: hypothetical protein ACOYI4_09615 [Christensenellales bacterium]|jgi:hypothetical protein